MKDRLRILGRGDAVVPALDRVSVEPSNRCRKACPFCYNASGPDGATTWPEDELVAFILDCAAHGVKAVSFGGGEPLEFPSLFSVLRRLEGKIFRSVTTSGLDLDAAFEAVVSARPDKVHVSIHQPGAARERDRVIRQVRALEAAGIRSGVNLLVRRSQLEDARSAAVALAAHGIDHGRIMFLPWRGAGGADTPSPRELAGVARDRPFQSVTCLTGCGASARFASIRYDRSAAWCSYTDARQPLAAPTHAALVDALTQTRLRYCG